MTSLNHFFAFNGEFYFYLYTTAIVTFQGPTDDLQITQKPWKELRRLRQKMEKQLRLLMMF